MPFELILSIECLFTGIALERPVVGMNQHVHLQILFSFERLLTQRTNEFICPTGKRNQHHYTALRVREEETLHSCDDN